MADTTISLSRSMTNSPPPHQTPDPDVEALLGIHARDRMRADGTLSELSRRWFGGQDLTRY